MSNSKQTGADTLTKAALGGDAEKRGKKYGKAHGYVGRAGGWIHDAQGRRICQGWWAFYNRNWQAVERERLSSSNPEVSK